MQKLTLIGPPLVVTHGQVTEFGVKSPSSVSAIVRLDGVVVSRYSPTMMADKDVTRMFRSKGEYTVEYINADEMVVRKVTVL